MTARTKGYIDGLLFSLTIIATLLLGFHAGREQRGEQFKIFCPVLDERCMEAMK